MTNNQFMQTSQHEREKLLYRYTNALERGDFDTVAVVLAAAEYDAALERMILEINEVYQQECEARLQASDDALIQQLLHQYMPTAMANEQEAEAPSPVTVNDVIARLRSDVEMTRDVKQEMQAVSKHLQRTDEPLPENLSQRGVRQFFERLGLSVSQPLQKRFRKVAILLSMGREQQVLAATRRQKKQQAKSPRREKKS